MFRYPPSRQIRSTVAFIQGSCLKKLLRRSSVKVLSVNQRQKAVGRKSLCRSFHSPHGFVSTHSFRMSAGPGGDTDADAMKDSADKATSIKSERILIFLAFAGLLIYSQLIAPGSVADGGELQKILTGNIDEVNDLFFAMFNLVGATSVNFAAALNPAAGQQKKLPTELFSFLGLFIGLFGLGPYLIGREYSTKVSREEVAERGIFSRILESRLFSGGTLIYTLWIYAFIFGAFTPGSEQLHDAMFYASSVDLGRMFSFDFGVRTTIIDTALLSICFWGPLVEDMKRRGWFRKGQELESKLTALSILSAPGLGPALYLTLRPRLPSRNRPEKKSSAME